MRKLANKASKRSITTESFAFSKNARESQFPAGFDARDKLKTITITLEYYQNVVGLFAISDLRARYSYKDTDLGETNSIPLTDDDTIRVDYSFSFNIDDYSLKDLNSLLSNPGILSIYQSPGVFDQSIYDQLQPSEQFQNVSKAKSFDSLVSVYEAFTGKKLDVAHLTTEKRGRVQRSKSEPVTEKKKEKPKPEKKEKKGKKNKSLVKPISSSQSLRQSTSSFSNVQQTLYGICLIDFLPLFHGKTKYSETLLIKPLKHFSDERMQTFKNHPKVVITVSVEHPLNVPDNVILNFTIESIYNLPSVMRGDMDYKVCAILPMDEVLREKLLFTNPIHTSNLQGVSYKSWSNLSKMDKNVNTTLYKVSDDNEAIVYKFDEDIISLMQDQNPRLEFNMLRRYLMSRENMNEFFTYLKSYRKIVLEIYMTPKLRKNLQSPYQPDNEEITSPKKSKIIPNLHMMAILDVSALLFPGVTRARVACQLRTYHLEEIKRIGGLNESFFIPQPKKDMRDAKETLQKDSPDKKGNKKKSKDKSSTSKTSITKQHRDEIDHDLSKLLPTKSEELPEPDPSSLVFSENGHACFIVVEIEFSEPVIQKREIEDLSNDLHELLLKPKPMQPNKAILTNCLTKDYYREVLSEIINDLNNQYGNFISGKRNSERLTTADFIKYLSSIGSYQKYLSSIMKAASFIINNKLKNSIDTEDTSSPEYNNFVAEVFLHLVSEMNDFVNKLICNDPEPTKKEENPADNQYFYAKEAAQLQNWKLADRYFLERIHANQESPDFLFDYAVFNIEMGDNDKAFECVKEALSLKSDHIYSLTMLGVFMADKDHKEEAETCFLNLVEYAPRWLEGWGVLYLFYQKYKKIEGMDVALEMARKYINDERKSSGTFEDFDDLLWTNKIIPNTIFFRTAMLLLKMRLYDWSEYACAEEMDKNYGLANYLLSAICFYKRSYSHALEHVAETKDNYGGNYAVYAISGHCLMALGKYERAQKEYYHALESFDRPINLHLVNMNCADIINKLGGNDQEARKLTLNSCKYNPSPYTWMRAGELYFQENDLLSAEECFIEGNFRDNRYGEIWGYLALVNSKLCRFIEAELCYNQALKNDLDNKLLLKMISFEKSKWKTCV